MVEAAAAVAPRRRSSGGVGRLWWHLDAETQTAKTIGGARLWRAWMAAAFAQARQSGAAGAQGSSVPFIERGGKRKGQRQQPAMNGLVAAAVTDGRKKWATVGH